MYNNIFSNRYFLGDSGGKWQYYHRFFKYHSTVFLIKETVNEYHVLKFFFLLGSFLESLKQSNNNSLI